jgi:hypothetical protein
VTRRRKRPPLEPSPLLVELAAADDPPTELEPYLARLRNGGATELGVGALTDSGAIIPVSTTDQAGGRDRMVISRSSRVVAFWPIGLPPRTTAPMRQALEGLLVTFEGFDQISRLRLATTDMQLVAHAADGLIEARDQRGAARIFERIIETGMVVTYARPFLPSNEAGLGRRWWPQDDAGRELHEELVDLRGEYHAHAEHTPQRRLEMLTGFTQSGRPLLVESWSQLPIEKLRLLEDVAKGQAQRFEAEAERLDLELFGPRDVS